MSRPSCFITPRDLRNKVLRALKGDTPIEDSFVRSSKVVGLDSKTLRPYVDKNDLTLVMFYDREDKLCGRVRRHFKEAAKATVRPGHAYAALDCEKNMDFCMSEGVFKLPSLVMYKDCSKRFMSSVDEDVMFYDIQMWVEAAPDSELVPRGLDLDPYIGSDHVISLRSDNFDLYLKGLDIAMVMFYHKKEPQCDWSRKHFKKAAALTTREGHQFAAMDCEDNSNLCVEEGVTGFPHFKIYSRGDDVGFSSDARKLLYQDMKTWVEGFPLPLQADARASSH